MNLHRALLATSLLYSFHLFSFSIQPEPLRTVYTPDSILNRKQQYIAAPVGPRMRHATCTGAAWFHEKYLATLNVYGEHIITYRFDEEKKEFTFLQKITNKHGAQLKHPENLAASPDGRLLAVVNPGSRLLSIYAIDVDTHLINPIPIFSLPCRGFVHGVRFSPDGNYLAYVSFDHHESICVYKVVNNPDNFNLESVCKRANDSGLKTKSINFTQDGRYAILVCTHCCGDKCSGFKNVLIVHRFDQLLGTVGEIVCTVPGEFFTEDSALSLNNDTIILSDQGHDALIIYPFDPETGQVDDNYTSIQNPEAQLSFPHSMGISPDGKYLIVTNYGDDKFNLYQID